MKSNSGSIVTTLGASEPHWSAGVGGSGVKIESNVAGPLRSTSSERESVRIASQASATLFPTSVEENEDRSTFT